MTDFVFAIPGDLGRPTGGYIYDRRVIEECRRAGGNAAHLALPDGFPFPSAEVIARSGELLHALPPGLPVLIDGLGLGALPAGLLRGLRRPLAALVHHPLVLETGLVAAQQAQLFASEYAALAEVSAVIVTSPMTARILVQDYAVVPEKLVVALPGTEPAARATGTSTPPRILAVGSVIPRKAHGVLVEALHGLRARDWTCHIVGATDSDAGAARALRTLIEARGLADRIVLTGAMTSNALEGEFQAADIFVSASLYEGYGMALIEAVARGLPVVATNAGAIPETLPAGTALLVPPGDAGAVAEAIGHLLDQPQLRRAMADRAWEQAHTLPRWSQTAAVIAATMGGLAR
ncbi:glycosyltransferase family 4 protein [Ancylobacter sp. A5.8]|uniref:glycosyltransferase family 4 protein n=1 Tax=Ancylobacter gelatini TaxID=2919920 RepID=UPI001F4E97B9|nr:glycosyltransferase family 4 protein [Ancylobacter gelatini]MCJ8143326.1 glycosyltransferase family 4 protein [Ancylobacter gelatini]